MDIEKKIKSQIQSSKKDMRLDTFINYALFSKNGYYFNKKPIGSNYDFVTSPEISQMFGEIIGLYIYYIWQSKINRKFNLIELGPGRGTLFNDIVNTVSKYPNFLKDSNIILVEINKKLIKLQKQNINNIKSKNIKWSNKINFNSKLPSIIYSNEFFDCFPVRQFILKNNWLEKYVSFNTKENKFLLKDRIVKSKLLLKLLNKYKKEKLLELSFERNRYYEKICKFIKNRGGLFFTIDYGYFKNIKNFSLQAIQNHKYSHVLEQVGNKDISSHVNFIDLLNIAEKNKLQIEECCSQREFLIKYGILERKNNLSKKNDTNKLNVELDKLISKKHMGNLFKCLIVSNI